MSKLVDKNNVNEKENDSKRNESSLLVTGKKEVKSSLLTSTKCLSRSMDDLNDEEIQIQLENCEEMLVDHDDDDDDVIVKLIESTMKINNGKSKIKSLLHNDEGDDLIDVRQTMESLLNDSKYFKNKKFD